MSKLAPLAYRFGLLSLRRTMRSRHTLTTVMFHRVLEKQDERWECADRHYSIEAGIFDDLTAFFKQHFRVVSLSDVSKAAHGSTTLPPNALLITFDDGWRDNLDTAGPILKRRGLPATVFVAADAVSDTGDAWWQETIDHAVRNGLFEERLIQSGVQLPELEPQEQVADSPLLQTFLKVAKLPEDDRQRVLLAMPCPAAKRRQMMRPEDLPTLADYGLSIGLHGASHLPLSAVHNPAEEMKRARAAIREWTNGQGFINALSAPHGRYNQKVLEVAREEGIELFFTSAPNLMPLPDVSTKAGAAPPIGRIDMPGYWLRWQRPIQAFERGNVALA